MKRSQRTIIRIGALLLLLCMLLPLLPRGRAASMYTVKSTSSKTLAPGITQKIHTASYGDGTKDVKYYVATADLNRSDVLVLNGYKNNNPTYGAYSSVTVDQQVIASETAHSDPSSSRYIENYHVIAACNGGFFNIPSISGIEGVKGAFVMDGVQYWDYDGRPFMAVLKNGTAVVGAGNTDWNKYRAQMQEAISGNVLLVNKGKINTGNVDEDAAFVGQESGKLGTGRHPRTCVGITTDNKVVMVVIDAQQTAGAGTRGGATLTEAAQILIDASCYYAINMDGGGSSTYMTKAENATTPTLVNVPSDSGKMRAIAGSLLFASTAPTDHLSFEFDGTGSNRYIRSMYVNRNYDTAGNWATGLAGSTTLGNYAVVTDTNAGTMTVNLNDRNGNGHSTYFAPCAKNATFDEAKVTTTTAFHMKTATAEVFRIRLKFKDAVRYSSSNTPFIGFGYLPSDTRVWKEAAVKVNIPLEYIDGGSKEDQYVTLEADLTNHAIRNSPEIVSMMIQIGYLLKGTCTIDSIYIGPKPQDHLFFGFSEFMNDPSSFNDPAYGYLDFDRKGHWYKGNEISSYDIGGGALKITVDNSPANINNAYVETSLTNSKSVHPLHYLPKAGDIIQIRYKVQKYDKATNASLYTSTSETARFSLYGYNDRQNVYSNITCVLDTSHSNYVVGQWNIPQAWTGYDLSKLRLTLRYFVNSTIWIDSIYVGPASNAPKFDRLHIGFDDLPEDHNRYSSTIYGGLDYDKPGSWSVGTEFALPSITGGYMKITPGTGFGDYGYVHGASLIGGYAMSYVPNANDYLQVRFKIDNGVASNKYSSQTGNGRFAFFYGNKDLGTRNNFVYYDFKVADVSGKGWITITYKLKDMKTSGTNLTAVSEITSISPCFNWIKSADGKTVNYYIDYIYVGPQSGIPTPQYTVTFKNVDGSTLATQVVHKGDTATYTGATPKKANDASNHYTFKGWDKALTNISANTTITATYTAIAHSYSYSKVDGSNHKASCSCGYSKNEGHSYSYKATTNPTLSATGVITGTCSKCSQTTTVTLPKLNTTDYTKSTTKSPTCTATGTDSYKWKTTTYGTYTFSATTNALGHNYSGYKATTNPTTSATGVLTGTCSRCSGTTTVTLPKLNTTDYTKTTTAATCTANGTDKYTWKTTTYGSFSFSVTINKLGHNYTGYKATTNPTTSATGVLTGTCSRCSGTTTVTLPKLNTTDYTKTTTAATCTASGADKYTWKTTTYGSRAGATGASTC